MEFTHNKLETLIRRMLRPLVSLLIKNSVSFQRLSNLLRELYVDVAAEEFGKNGRPTNITRISILTGLDRKKVKEIREQTAGDHGDDTLKSDPAVTQDEHHNATQSTVLGRILSAWHQDAEFATQGKPRALTTNDEFIALCKRYGGDKTHTSILNELLRVKAIEKMPGSRVLAVSRYYMPEKTNPEALARSLDVYHGIGKTLVHNLYRNTDQPSHFEGRATNPHVPVSKVDDFRIFVEQQGQSFLEKVDARLSAYEQTAPASEESARVGLGLYWIEDESENAK